MSDMLAYCGLDCAACGAYKATVANDDELRKQTAEEWSKMFGGTIDYKDINCLGCKSDLRFSHCSQCELRSCGISNNVENCAVCKDFGCERNTGFMSMAPEAKSNLEKIRGK